jgi:hypothetical protein
LGHVLSAVFTKCFGHPPLTVAVRALYLHLCGLPSDTKLTQSELWSVARKPSMHEFNPGKVVEVPLRTSDQESSRNSRWSLLGFGAVLMDILGSVGMKGVRLQLKKPGIHASQHIA